MSKEIIMKNFTYRLWAKILTFVMLILFVGGTIAMGALFFEAESRNVYDYDSYEDYAQADYESGLQDLARGNARHFVDIFENVHGDVSQIKPNFSYGANMSVMENGKEIFSDVDESADYAYTYETTITYFYGTYETGILDFDPSLFDSDSFDVVHPMEENVDYGDNTFISEDGIIYHMGEEFQGKDGTLYYVDNEGSLTYTIDEQYVGELDITVHLTEESAQDVYTHYGSEMAKTVHEEMFYNRDVFIPLAIVFAVCALFNFILLTVMAGRKLGHVGVHLNAFDRIPLELIAIIPAFIYVIFDGFYYYSSLNAFGIAALFILVFAFYMTFVTRIKAGEWWKNTLVYKALRLVHCFFKFLSYQLSHGSLKTPFVLRAVFLYLALQFFDLILIFAFSHEGGILVVFNVLESLIVGFLFFVCCSWFAKLHKGAQRIANGDFETKTDTKYMRFDFLNFANDLNRVGDGMNLAMNEKLKSERLKTELITNVSHDIKTPLTSIINYVDLIKKEETDNEKISEYTEVLDRQSQKLNRLIVDLVEASKISSGNISVDAQTTDLCVIAQQIKGEYEEKLSKRNLTLILKTPEVPVNVSADSRHLQRIFDNLMVNVLKYSLEGTRVYIDVSKDEKSCNIILKNTSATALNISADELMERFVRGDSSRNTDGNGLGLSIAQSLAKVQGAELGIDIDGDLFKVSLRFFNV